MASLLEHDNLGKRSLPRRLSLSKPSVPYPLRQAQEAERLLI